MKLFSKLLVLGLLGQGVVASSNWLGNAGEFCLDPISLKMIYTFLLLQACLLFHFMILVIILDIVNDVTTWCRHSS